VWTAVERPLPVEDGPVAAVAAAPGWLVSARPADGIALVHNHGSDHARPGAECADSPLYARLGYSTATVPPLTGGSVADPVDNAVVIVDGEGRATHRSGFETLYAEELTGGVLAAASRGPVRWVDAGADHSPDHGSGRTGVVTPGPVVTVASVVREGVEVRLARVDAAEAPASWRSVRFGGWPLAAAERPRTGPGARAATDQLHSRLVPLRGLGESGVVVERGTSPLGERTAIPWLATAGPLPLGEVLAAAVVLDRDPNGPDPDVTVTVRPGDDRVAITWPDGLVSEVRLPPG
jgi:hypothetical protein